MNENKQLKKLIVFSNEENKIMIEKYLALESYIQHQTLSYLFEKRVLNDIIPQNKNFEYTIRNFLCFDYSLNQALSDICAFLSTGIDWKNKYENCREVVDFTHALLKAYPKACIANNNDIPYLINAFDSIFYIISNESKTDETGNESENYRINNNNIEYTQIMLERLKNSPENIEPFLYAEHIYNNWQYLCSSTWTFRFLSVLLRSTDSIEGTPQQRYDFIQLVRENSKHWP